VGSNPASRARIQVLDQRVSSKRASPFFFARAAFRVPDHSAKAVMTERPVLEAKRLLVRKALLAATTGNQFGFGGAANFVKFFRREAGQTPRACGA
jgi:AraC-like DNA-binding protein